MTRTLNYRLCCAVVASLAHLAGTSASQSAPSAPSRRSREEVLLGRELVINHACAGCHGGLNPVAEVKWLAGMQDPLQEFYIGACAVKPGAEPCWKTRARNLTPDNATGIGRFSERQIFNALR